MKNGTEKYIETVKYLGKLYDYVNGALFKNELTKPVITVQLDERNKTYGWWSVKKVWKWQDTAPANCAECATRDDCKNYAECAKLIDCEEHELNITAQFLNHPINQIAATLIHEMCHQYATINNIQDTSRSHIYHNKLFKKIAEIHGLKVEFVKTIGWSHTELTEDSEKLIAAFVSENPESIIYRAPVIKGGTVKTSSTRKYVCPVCGQSVRATKQVNIICADCDEPMTEEE